MPPTPATSPLRTGGYLEWTPERLITWAETVGAHTAHLVRRILETRVHPEQGYRSCLGIMRLAKRYPQERLEGSLPAGRSNPAPVPTRASTPSWKGASDQVPFSGTVKTPTYSRHAYARQALSTTAARKE